MKRTTYIRLCCNTIRPSCRIFCFSPATFDIGVKYLGSYQ